MLRRGPSRRERARCRTGCHTIFHKPLTVSRDFSTRPRLRAQYLVASPRAHPLTLELQAPSAHPQQRRMRMPVHAPRPWNRRPLARVAAEPHGEADIWSCISAAVLYRWISRCTDCSRLAKFGWYWRLEVLATCSAGDGKSSRGTGVARRGNCETRLHKAGRFVRERGGRASAVHISAAHRFGSSAAPGCGLPCRSREGSRPCVC